MSEMRDMADPNTLGHGTSRDFRNVDAISAPRCCESAHTSSIRAAKRGLTEEVYENLHGSLELQEKLLHTV